METKRRTLVKALCWQMLGLLIMTLVGFLVTGSVLVGGVTAVVNTMIGLVIYVLYERFWNRVSWGRLPVPAEWRDV